MDINIILQSLTLSFNNNKYLRTALKYNYYLYYSYRRVLRISCY